MGRAAQRGRARTAAIARRHPGREPHRRLQPRADPRVLLAPVRPRAAPRRAARSGSRSLRALVLGRAAPGAGQDDLSPDRADGGVRRVGRRAVLPRSRPPRRGVVAGGARSHPRRTGESAHRPPAGPHRAHVRVGPGAADPAHRAAEGSRRRPAPQRFAAERLHRRGARSWLSREGSAAAAGRAPLPAVAGSERLRRDLRPGHRLQRARRPGARGAAHGARRHRRRHVRDPLLRVPALRHRSPAGAAGRGGGRRRHDGGCQLGQPRRPGRSRRGRAPRGTP